MRDVLQVQTDFSGRDLPGEAPQLGDRGGRSFRGAHFPCDDSKAAPDLRSVPSQPTFDTRLMRFESGIAGYADGVAGLARQHPAAGKEGVRTINQVLVPAAAGRANTPGENWMMTSAAMMRRQSS